MRTLKPWVDSHSDVAKQWHPEKNSKQPHEVGAGSEQRIWWLCEHGHEWEASPYSRVRLRSNCPVCSGRSPSKELNLKTAFPSLVKEWHVLKNNKPPDQFTSGSSQNVWWQCQYGHEWMTSIINRTKPIGTGCPYCAGKKADASNSILLSHPSLCLQYHPTKNDADLITIRPKSHKKAWWVCNKGHEWQATFASRTHGASGCPLCCQKSRSKLEVRIYCELKTLFDGVTLKDTSFGKEMDVYIPTLRIGIETDGHRWHVQKEMKDIAKTEFFSGHGITIIRLRQQPLQPLGPYDITFKRTMSHKHEIVAALIEQIEIASGMPIPYDSTHWLNDVEYLHMVQGTSR